MTKTFFASAAFLATAVCAHASSAFPAGAAPSIMIGDTPQGGKVAETFTVTNGTSAVGSFSTSNANGAASADLTTGLLHLYTTGTSTPSMTVDPFEFVQFSGTGTVSYSMAVDGSISNFSANGDASISAGVYVYDVTGYTAPFFTTQSSGNEYVTNGYQYMYSGSRTVDVYGSSYPTDDLPIDFENNLVTLDQDNSGVSLPINFDVTGSIDVVAGHTYIIQLLMTAGDDQLSGSASQTVGFANTGAFNFTNLNGLTFTSSSGQFLSDVVPEPGTWMLAGAGLLALVIAASRRRFC
jgi:hypothetical protein